MACFTGDCSPSPSVLRRFPPFLPLDVEVSPVPILVVLIVELALPGSSVAGGEPVPDPSGPAVSASGSFEPLALFLVASSPATKGTPPLSLTLCCCLNPLSLPSRYVRLHIGYSARALPVLVQACHSTLSPGNHAASSSGRLTSTGTSGPTWLLSCMRIAASAILP